MYLLANAGTYTYPGAELDSWVHRVGATSTTIAASDGLAEDVGARAALHAAVRLVGDKWTLLIVGLLMEGPRRFKSIHELLPDISANVLTQRLRRLEVEGLIVRRELYPRMGVRGYALTGRGRGLEHVLRELGTWGARSDGPDGRS